MQSCKTLARSIVEAVKFVHWQCGSAGGLRQGAQAYLLALLQVRTYAVLSITSNLGMLEFVGGTQALKQAITHPSLVTQEVRTCTSDTTPCPLLPPFPCLSAGSNDVLAGLPSKTWAHEC